ncbi:MAG: HipA N-terminal domain-containing protein [Gammaproteobacteria bacterium]|jgi:serine/threonine-protein kinase HipA
MRIAKVFVNKIFVGRLIETDDKKYCFEYNNSYKGLAISLTMPITQKIYEFDKFPSFFDGLLPEGAQLEALLLQVKLDRNDYFGQLVTVGADLVGTVTVSEEM